MGFDKKNNTSRRKFIKGIASATVCSCVFIWEDKFIAGREYLAAACGTFCGACPAYLAKHSTEEQIKKRLDKRLASGQPGANKGIPDAAWMNGLLCDGCLSGGTLAPHCKSCAIRKCAANKQSDSRCSDCGELPCSRITGLIGMGGYLHRKEYLPNLKKIGEMGAGKWSEYEEERWRCPKCNNPMSWYDPECTECSEPRSGKLFPLI